jgi:hypothetical protein
MNLFDPSPSFYDPPLFHNEECNCSECHQQHVEQGIVDQNAMMTDYKCCESEFQAWVDNGEWCTTCNTGVYILDKNCENCNTKVGE